MLSETAAALRRRGFEVETAATKAEALALVLEEAGPAASVGCGGGETIKEIGARARLVESGKEIRDHRLACDLFLLSANALTSDGRIVNVDGNGNRVAASICGPKRVVYVIGRNKIVDGGLDEAVARIRRCACPPNAKRLGRRTPCGIAGACVGGEGCDSPDRMCKVTAVFDRRPTGTPTKVILVDEDLGY
jgi:hypothetical protein